MNRPLGDGTNPVSTFAPYTTFTKCFLVGYELQGEAREVKVMIMDLEEFTL